MKGGFCAFRTAQARDRLCCEQAEFLERLFVHSGALGGAAGRRLVAVKLDDDPVRLAESAQGPDDAREIDQPASDFAKKVPGVARPGAVLARQLCDVSAHVLE